MTEPWDDIASLGDALSGVYRDLEPLSTQGAQSIVYKAIANDGELVVVKIYKAEHVEERSQLEIDALTHLTSETTVHLHGAGDVVIDGKHFRYLATNFIVGEPLSQLLQNGALEPRRAATIGRDIASAVDELWSIHAIVHRDIKPANIMVKGDGHGVLIDLGLARHLDRDRITGPGIAWGTLGYYAPERLLRPDATCKADIFSLGVVLQEMLLGRHPTHGHQELLQSGAPKTLVLKPDTPGMLAALIDGMVLGKPHVRPGPRDVVRQLEKFLSSAEGAS